MIVLLIVGTGVWVWLASGDVEPTELPQAAVNTDGAPTGTPRMAVNAASGGLGLTVDEWRAVYGAPIGTQFDEYLDRYPGDGGYDVDIRFVMNPTDRMTNLEFNFDPPVAPDVAETVVSDYLPTDATVVDEYRDDLADQPVVLYQSDWLAETLGPGSDDIWWGDAQSGSFFVIYGWQDNDLTTGVITNAMVGLSHSP